MTKSLHFFSTTEDLLALTQRVESAGAPLRYVRQGIFSGTPYESFDSAAQIPNLGLASQPSAVSCDSFLVCNCETVIKPRQLKRLTEGEVNRPSVSIGGQQIVVDRDRLRAIVGLDRFAIDQLQNPDTIVFRPAGRWDEDTLLAGEVGTASGSKLSVALFKRFSAVTQAQFVKTQAFYVGPVALELLKHGKRLTISVQSPRDLDLATSF